MRFSILKNKMKIAIVGYGKMGKIIERICKTRGHDIVTIDPATGEFKEINSESLDGVDCCIEFTAPTVALGNIQKISTLGKNVVCGSTGWYDSLDEAKGAVEEAGNALLYSPNFSVGVNVFFEIVKKTARMIGKLDYSLEMKETHHIHKVDKPSGTGKKIGEIIAEEASKYKDVAIESIREGEVPGTHEVVFKSDVDTITLEHKSHSREGFALGSVMGAEWLQGKKGVFSIEDFMAELIK